MSALLQDNEPQNRSSLGGTKKLLFLVPLQLRFLGSLCGLNPELTRTAHRQWSSVPTNAPLAVTLPAFRSASMGWMEGQA